MSGNKIGSSPNTNPSPDDPEFLAAAEAGLSTNVPSQPFSINPQNQNQNQNQNQDDDTDSSSQAAKAQAKKELIKKDQQQAAITKQGITEQQQKAGQSPSPLDSSFHKKGTPTSSAPSPQPQAPVGKEPQKTDRGPFSLVQQNTKPQPKTTPGMEKQPLPSSQTPKAPLTPPSPKQPQMAAKPVSQPSGQEKQTGLADANQPKQPQGAQEALTGAGAKPQEPGNILQNPPPVSSGINARFTGANQKLGNQESASISAIDKKAAGEQKRVKSDTQDYRYKENLEEKADTKDNRLEQKAANTQVAEQTQARTDVSVQTAAGAATGADVAARAEAVLRTQDDFINLVASVATNEKQTSVTLKDGTLIDLRRTDAGLDIAVTTKDSRIQRLVLDNRESIKQALNGKNIKVANLQVSMEYSTGVTDRPVEGVGREP